MAHLVLQPPLIDGPQLLQQDDRILHDRILRRIDLDMGRQLCLVHLGCDRGTDHRRTVLIPDIVLYDQDRADPTLFAADHWS